MKKLFLILFLLTSSISYSQDDSTLVYKIVVEIPNITEQELNDISNLITDSDIFGFTIYCTDEKLFLIESTLDLNKEETELMFSPAIEVEKLCIKNPDNYNEYHCKGFNNLIIQE